MFLFHGVHPKKISAPALILTLLSSALAGTLFEVFAATAGYDCPTVSIVHPKEGTVFGNNSVFLEFDVKPPTNFRYAEHFIHEIYYGMDEGAWNLVYQSVQLTFPLPEAEILYAGVARLREFHSNLTVAGVGEGFHTFRVKASFIGVGPYPVGSAMVGFTVDTSPPRVKVLSPEPVAYDGSEVPLTFTLNEPVSEMVYCLDGGENVTLTGNATLVGLSGGRHTLVLYATDVAGNTGKSEVLAFDVAIPNSLPANLIVIAVAVIGSAAVVSFGLLAYFLRRKSKRGGKT
jgi:uncharacterized integral membrane protein